MIGGIDEAGRGPVLGPLVVAGVAVEAEGPLRALGVRDSKRLTAERRELLDRAIRRCARVRVEVVPAEAIDRAREGMTLNVLEAKLFARIIEGLGASTVYVDAAHPDALAFRRMIEAELATPVEVVSQHEADDRFPVVSAASIVAKVRRDAEVRRIRDGLGVEVGSGYAHDGKTLAFLENWIREKGCLPPHTRASWGTARRLVNRALLRRLDEYPGDEE